MPLPHPVFAAFNFAIFLAVLLVDRKRAKSYLLLGLFGLFASFVFENATTYFGFWNYHSEPKVLFVSLYTWLLYVPYLSFCYFVGNKMVKPHE